MPIAITACTDLRSPCTFVAKVEVYRWEENFGVTADWWLCSLYESGASVLVLFTKGGTLEPSFSIISRISARSALN